MDKVLQVGQWTKQAWLRERSTRRQGDPDGPGPDDGDGGPARPKVERPDTRDLLRRMRRVDPDQARRYRQRTGE